MNPMLEARVIRLEESSYFQEEKLKTLDAAVAAQQKQLDELAAQVKAMQNALQRLRETSDAMHEKGLPENTVPPHYQQEKW